MKFNNGYWLLRKGVSAFPCVDVRDAKIESERVTLYAAVQQVTQRGQTLAGPLLTLTVTSPAEDVLQIGLKHYTGTKGKGPVFPVADEHHSLTAEDSPEAVTAASGKLTAVITKFPFKIDYFYDGKFLTSSGHKQLAYMTTDDGAYMRERLNVSVGENIYGFGERFTPFVKNGQAVDIWNEDGGTASEQAYKSVPFCISNRGYGIFVNHPEKVSFEVCSEAVSKMQFSVRGEELNYMVVGGGRLRNVLTNYTKITGRPALPPAWSFGLWLSTSFTTDYDEKTVTSFIDGMLERNIPLSVFHFDCFWMKEYEWCNFAWDENAFPDPDGMLKRLKEKGLKICVWINPYIGQKSPLFEEGAEKGYLIKNPEGGAWQWDLWQPGLAVVDFTNPAAAEWYQGYLRRLMAQGVDAFKTDFGERIPVECAYHDGSDPLKTHNFYSYLYNKAVFDAVREVKGEGEAVLFARSATAGGQKFPVHWGGDCEATYESMAESLRGGLSLSVCGFGFWSHDIGGFESTATPDLYKRWVAFGLLSSHSRLHGSTSYRVPWLFDEEAVEAVRFFSKLKCSLMPYIFAQAVTAHESGIPVMRPMVLEYQDDPACVSLDRQYMFGESLLVSPVFNPEGATSAYLPQGVWTEFFTGGKINGGRFVNGRHDYKSLGLWVKPNSIVAFGNTDARADYDFADNPVFRVYELEDACAVIYGANGKAALSVHMTRKGEAIAVSVKEKRHGRFHLLLVNIRSAACGDNRVSCMETEAGTLVEVTENCTDFVLRVTDGSSGLR